jgi:hypothetical protein
MDMATAATQLARRRINSEAAENQCQSLQGRVRSRLFIALGLGHVFALAPAFLHNFHLVLSCNREHTVEVGIIRHHRPNPSEAKA